MSHIINERDRQHRRAEFMKNVTVVDHVPPEPTQQPPAPRMSQDALQLLIQAATHPDQTLLEIYAATNLHVSHGRRAVEELQAKKMITTISLVREGRGGQPKVIRLQGDGKNELAERGIKPVGQVVTRGSFEHDVYSRIIGRGLRADGSKVAFEKWFGNKSLDVLGEKQGVFTGYEVVCSGSGEWNAKQSMKAALVPGLAKVIVACKSKAVMKQIEKVLEVEDQLGFCRDKIEIRFLGEFVSAVLAAKT